MKFNATIAAVVFVFLAIIAVILLPVPFKSFILLGFGFVGGLLLPRPF